MNWFDVVLKLRWRNRLPALAVLAISSPTFATNLLDCYRLAQASDPVFESARFSLETVRQKIPEARAALLPQINGTGNKGTTKALTEFTDVGAVDRKMKSWSWNVQLTQPVIRVGSLYALSESEAFAEQAAEQYRQAEQDLLVRLTQAYFAVVIAQDVIKASEAEIRSLEEQLAQVRHGLASGTHSQTDVDDTRARLGVARSRAGAAENDLESKQADLEKITGQPVTDLAVLRPAFLPTAPSPAGSRLWIDQARTNHPLVLAQRAALAAASSEIKKSRAEYLPTLDLVASYGNNYSSNSLTTPNDFSTRGRSGQVGLQLNVPLFAGGATRAKVAEAVAGRGKAEAEVEGAARQAASDAKQAYSGVINGLAEIDALTSAVEAAQSAVKGNSVGYRLGIKINVDVLNAEEQLYSARRDLTKARYDTVVQSIKLKAATGILAEGDLMELNALLGSF